MDTLRLATVWLGGCSGCHMSLLDLDEFVLELATRVAIVYSPLADVKEYPDGVDVALIEGAVCNEEHRDQLVRIRSRTRVLVALGDCAVTGNVPALRNALGAGNVASVLRRAYTDLAEPGHAPPAPDGILPRLLDSVLPLHEVVPIDLFLPGCPPPADRIRRLLEAVLAGKPPALAGADLKFG